MVHSPSWEDNSFSASQKFPTFYGTRRFITALTSVRHLSLSWARSFQSTSPRTTSWRSILILSSHLRLHISSGLFPSGFPTKSVYMPLLSPIRDTYPTHLMLDFITRTILGEECRSLRSSLCSFLHSPVTSSLLDPNILLNALFSSGQFSVHVNTFRYVRGKTAIIMLKILAADQPRGLVVRVSDY